MFIIEGVKYRFSLTPEDLYTMRVSKDVNGIIFGKKVINNKTKKGDARCQMNTYDYDSQDINSKEAIEVSYRKPVQFAEVATKDKTIVTKSIGVVDNSIAEANIIDMVECSRKRFS